MHCFVHNHHQRNNKDAHRFKNVISQLSAAPWFPTLWYRHLRRGETMETLDSSPCCEMQFCSFFCPVTDFHMKGSNWSNSNPEPTLASWEHNHQTASGGLRASGFWEVLLISFCPPECTSVQLQGEETAEHPISPISTSFYPRWFGPSLGRWEMWFGSLQAEESTEARFLTSWASDFANLSPDKKKRKRCVHPCLGLCLKRVSKAQLWVLPDVSPREWARPSGTQVEADISLCRPDSCALGWVGVWAHPLCSAFPNWLAFRGFRCTTWSLAPGLLPVVADFLVLSLQAWGCSRTREEVKGKAPLSEIPNTPNASGREGPDVVLWASASGPGTKKKLALMSFV